MLAGTVKEQGALSALLFFFEKKGTIGAIQNGWMMEMASLFEKPIETLYGVGKRRGELLRKLGAGTVGDLLRFYPRAYEDHSHPVLIQQAPVGEICCIQATLEAPVMERRISGGRLLSRVGVYDESGHMQITFFNNRFIKDMLKMGETYVFYGKMAQNAGRKEMVSPDFSPLQGGQRVRPVYSVTSGLSSRQVEAAVKEALKLLPQTVKEPIPPDIMKSYALCPLRFAIENIHFPADAAALQTARKRLIFEELLVLNLGLRQLKGRRKEEACAVLAQDFTKEFFARLPFTPTNAQKKAAEDCIGDMMRGKSPMNRLVQGDVGSGKTAVAAALCYSAVKNGWQAAFMAPTEILCEQHYSTFCSMLQGTDIRVALLTGSMTPGKKKKLQQQLAQGQIDLVIGTHALLSDGVEFRRLGLVVTDEQHRFGVAQRARLLSKGENPHLLVMSATPIPRTLALIIYGDLDITVIDQLPPGRQKVDTFLIDSSKRERMYNFLKKLMDQGRQCYIVCPAVEEGELNLTSVQEYAEDLMAGPFCDYAVGLLHGKMKSAQKDSVMRAFARGEIELLVATTVVEVGVDVPNAAVMAVENAERFGLSQLHQLRGRVGRGNYKSYCILISDAKNEEAVARLHTMCQTDNGFEIADADLKLRGPGDFFGARQHGLPELKIADLADMPNLAAAQSAAQEILSKSPDLSHPAYKSLRAEVVRLFGKVGENGLN